jgi:hypothetical protein
MKIHSFQHYSHGLEMAVHDAWITAKVKSTLAFSDPTLGLHINVKTHAGIMVSPKSMPATCRPMCSRQGVFQKRPTPKRALSAGHNRRQRWTTNDNGNFVGAALPVGNRERREAECPCAPE